MDTKLSAYKHKKSNHADLHISPHFDPKSFLALLVRSFVSFMLVTIILVVIIVLLTTWASKNNYIRINRQTIYDYRQELIENPSAPNVPVNILFGAPGWLDIVDESGTVVSSTASRRHTYDPIKLKCIPDFGFGTTVRYSRPAANEAEIIAEDSDNEKTNHLIVRKFSHLGHEEEEYVLLSPQLTVISSTIFAAGTQLGEEELSLLTYYPTNGGPFVEKYAFEGVDGTKYFAVYLDTNTSEGASPYLFVAIIIIVIVLLFVIILAMYIRYINKHVQKPLKALNVAMTDFAVNGYRQELKYTGSKEFEQLVNSFNEMVALLDASERQRQQLAEENQRMLAGLSHDLKTPITVIQGFSKAIRDGLVKEEDKVKYINLILAKAENMSSLINGFYEYSRLDHPDFRLDCTPVDLAELARTYLAQRYDEFELQGYALEADITEEVLTCNVDKPQLTRVFDNLTSNFFRYTDVGCTLRISVYRDGDAAHIAFADNGAGIDIDARKDLFAPFVVGEASRNRQGSGLGLAVCQKIVSAHGGTISLSDRPAEGFATQFDISLPLYAPPEIEAPSDDDAAPKSAPPPQENDLNDSPSQPAD